MDELLHHLPANATLESSSPASLVRIFKSEEEKESSSSSSVSIPIAPVPDTTQQHSRILILGRQAASVDYVLPHKSISRQHAALCYSDNKLMILLVGKKSKTFVNGERSTSPLREIHVNDTVRFGNLLEYKVVSGIPQKETMDVTNNGDATAEMATTTTKQQTELDQEKMAQAGEGLSGRDKRQAEIAAMMDTFNHAPTYQKPIASNPQEEHQDTTDTTDTTTAAQLAQISQLAAHHRIPLAHSFPLANGNYRCTTIAIDPAGSRFAIGTTQLALQLYDFGGMNQLRTTPFTTLYPEPGFCPVAVSFAPDRLAVATGSAQPVVLNRQGERTLQCARGDMYVQDMHHTIAHTAAVTGIQWQTLSSSSHHNRFVTSSLDGSVRWWNVDTGKRQFDKLTCEKESIMVVKSQSGRKTTATAVAVHPAGRAVCVGTGCGSLQVWTRSNRPDRCVWYHAAAAEEKDNTSVRSIAFTADGKRMVCRYAHGMVEVRTFPQLHLWVRCERVPTVHPEHCNAVWSPDGTLVCAGSCAEDGSGALHFFAVPTSQSDRPVPPLLRFPLEAGATVVQWHPRIQQIFVGCHNGQAFVFSDPRFSTQGSVKASTKAGKRVDALETLLHQRAAGSVGQIIAPLHRDNLNVRKTKRKRADQPVDAAKEREPERPATGKHKAGGQPGAGLTFQQLVADKRIGDSNEKEITGKDPREALLQYTEGKSIVERAYKGNKSKLADKTAEQEEEEAKQEKKWM